MFEWEYLFEPHILKRGWRYANEGAVEHITRKDSQIEAVVAGSEYYKVVLEYNGPQISSAYCSCPYAAKGYYCKHMAAVLYAIDTEKTAELDNAFEFADVKSTVIETEEESSPVSIEQLITNAQREDLESILCTMALEDERVASRIRSHLSKTRIEINPSDLKWDIDDIFNTYTYKGYIDYYHAFQLAVDLTDYLASVSDQLCEMEKYYEAFELSMYAYVRLGNCDIDDDGEIAQITDVCYRIWQRIILNCPNQVKNKIKTWFNVHASDGTVIDFIEETLRDFQKYELASNDQLQEEIEALDQIIENCKGKTQCTTVYTVFYGYYIEAIDLRIILMRRLGASEKEVDRYRQNHMNFRSVRKYYLEKARKEGTAEKEIRLLQMSKKLDHDESYLVHTYTERLIELYHLSGDLESEKKLRKEDLLAYPLSSIEDFRSYREMCSAEEWEKDRLQIIASQYETRRKCELLAEEEMYDELMNVIMHEEQEERIKYLDRYGFKLAGEFSEEILNTYGEYVSEIASYARNRSSYEILIRYLLRMQQYDGGEELVKKLCKTWITQYPTRKLMVSELEKLLYR